MNFFFEIVSIAHQLVNKRRQGISVVEVSNCYYAISTVEWVGGKFSVLVRTSLR
ncbi:hypothetical protein [Scytonema hofmannii]|uniref:hypothetical protein n=1 Tax=Scytonema hofmannii TaxID=34078 RepID=UPI00034702E6|nr:hypothetical protein [Scytonema hofmannii]